MGLRLRSCEIHMQGLVTKSTGSGYLVLLDDGTQVMCRIKGNLRLKGIRTTNPVAVGDRVEVESSAIAEYSWITTILPRRNYIIRRSTNLSKQAHILAANLDQVALLVTLRHPETSTIFIDRFLATAEAYRVPAILIFNKVDLLTEEEQQWLHDLRQLYESLDYPTYAISAKQLNATGSPCAELNPLFQSKTTLLAGNSGVGKSTLLNAIFGKDLARTADLSDAHDTGMHTTTFSCMYPLRDSQLACEGWLMDIPGVKGFGSVEMEPHEVSHYFRDIFRIGQKCRYSDCLHTGEPGCAVRQALDEGRLAIPRYESYISMLGDSSETKYR